MSVVPSTELVGWDDACWEMIMECEDHEYPDRGFKTPSAGLVARYCLLYPQHAENFIDFAATCEAQERLLKLYPPPEPTKEELARAHKRAMHAVRNAMRRFQRALKTKAARE